MRSLLLIACIIAWVGVAPVFAGNAPFYKGEVQGRPVEHGLPKAVQGVGIDQKLGDSLSLSLPVRDEAGHVVPLGSFFGKRPVLLVLSYYGCPNLCTMVMNGVFSVMKTVPFTPGKDYDVVDLSIDPKETPELAAKKKAAYLLGFHQQQSEQAIHFLTAEQSTIDVITKQVGFRYTYDTASKQFAHASGIMLLTADGHLSRYFFGVEYSPKDLKLGIMDASGGKIGTVADKLLLYCYHYDPAQAKYGVAITNILKIGGGLTLLALGAMFLVLRKRARSKVQLNTGGMTG